MSTSNINKKDLKLLKSKLKKRKTRSQNELDTLVNLLKEQKQYIKSTDMSYDSDASKIRNYEMLKTMKRRTSNKLNKYRDALAKMKTGSYGICEKTGKIIKIERLMAMPEARTCIR